jgi:hypothetical protein
MSGSLVARHLLLVNTLALTLVPWPATQPQSAGEHVGVRGYVLTPDGMPVTEGTALVRSGLNIITTSIDRTGRFRVVPEFARPHELHVIVPGLGPYRVNVIVPSSRSLALPVIRLSPATYFRVHPVTATGNALGTPRINRQSLDLNGNPVWDPPGHAPETASDSQGIVTLGPLPRGITMLALDSPPFARPRLPDLYVSGADELLDAGTVIVEPGAVLHVDVVDENGAPLAAQDASIEDARPLSPLTFLPSRTNAQGRATFDRLASGQYRVLVRVRGRCGGRTTLTMGRLVTMSGSGTFAIRIVVGGTASFKLTSPYGPMVGNLVTVSPDTGTPSSPPWLRATSENPMFQRLLNGPFMSGPSCGGYTDGDGRLTLDDFPPGPARIEVRLPNSRYSRRVAIPEDPREIQVQIPDGLLPVLVKDALKRQPLINATVTWNGGGTRVEARTVASGDALLEGIAVTAGTLEVTAIGYERTQAKLSEPPASIHEVLLTPASPARVQVRVGAPSGRPLGDAVVELTPENPFDVGHILTTDSKGLATFADVPPGTFQLTAAANGFASVTSRIEAQNRHDIALVLERGYRVNVSVELPADAGRQLIRVVNEAGASLEASLDHASDRTVLPGDRLSLGPLAPGTYTIELHGTGGRRQLRVLLVDRDVSVTIR